MRWAVDENGELDDAVILPPWIGYGAAFGDPYDDRSRPRRGHGAQPQPAVSAVSGSVTAGSRRPTSSSSNLVLGFAP